MVAFIPSSLQKMPNTAAASARVLRSKAPQPADEDKKSGGGKYGPKRDPTAPKTALELRYPEEDFSIVSELFRPEWTCPLADLVSANTAIVPPVYVTSPEALLDVNEPPTSSPYYQSKPEGLGHGERDGSVSGTCRGLT